MAASQPAAGPVSALSLMLVFRESDPATGGLGIDVRDVAEGMAARGHRVTVVTTAGDRGAGGPADVGRGAGVETVELATVPPGRRCGVAYGLAAGVGRLVAERPDSIVHVYSCLPVYLHAAAMVAARRYGRPLVWTPMIHPARRGSWAAHGLPGRAMAGWDMLAPRAARHVDAVLAATHAEARAFRRVGAPRVEVIPPAVHPADPVSDSEAAAFRARLGLGDGPVVLCVAGRTEPRKGIDFALAAMTRLRRRIPAATLALVGMTDGPGQTDGVRSLGRLSSADLARAYRAADVVFVPSRYEAFSRVVVEAWQQARPVVVTDRVGLAETVHEGGGSVVAFGDAEAAASALAQPMLDLQGGAREGARGRQVVAERFVVEPVLDRLEAVYRGVAQGHTAVAA